jgi:hypothetical protein
MGLGEAVGRFIEESDFSAKDISVSAAGWRSGVPITAHVGIGHDIIHMHPNCDPQRIGRMSYCDFMIFAASVCALEGGAFANIGSSVTGPEVFLKALSMARNTAWQKGEQIVNFSTAVFDICPLPTADLAEVPPSDNAWYFYRPWKTLLARAVADGGRSYYIAGNHTRTIPALWNLLLAELDLRRGLSAGL